MSDSITRRMLAAYDQQAETVEFLSDFFRSPPQNFHTSEEVEFDVVRSDEDIAIVVQDLSAGYRENSADLYTNKSIKPPIFKERITLNSFDLIKRMSGQNPFESPDFRANLITRMFDGMVKVERKIRRSLELQSSQVLQTGTVNLADASGNVLYNVNYQPKATHFPTAGVSWATATGAQKLSDMDSLSEVIRNDGLSNPDQMIMGSATFENIMSDNDVLKRFDIRQIDLGTISSMQMRSNGGIFRGIIELGNYKYDVWTYAGRYKDPQTGTKIQFVDPGNIIMRSSSARMDATFGAIPNIGNLMGASVRVLPELPGRFTNAAGGMDLFTNVWISNDGEQIFGGVGARPLMIPTAIDTYGCLTTGL